LRSKSFAALTDVFHGAQQLVPDADMVVAGDFNTMGCSKCSPKSTAKEELVRVESQLASAGVPFALVVPELSCSEYYSGHAGLLDHFVVSRGTRELPRGARTVTSGYCGRAECAGLPSRRMPAAYERLSDHCPLVLDLTDQDLD
jgi:predicted extracellular nuclease